MDEPRLSLEELAERSATAARTIRFYIARGLLDGPAKAGRGAYYGRSHLERLERIRQLQNEGLMLAQIAARLNGGSAGAALPAAQSWLEYEFGGDVKVLVREGAAPWRLRRIRAALEEFAKQLEESNHGGDGG